MKIFKTLLKIVVTAFISGSAAGSVSYVGAEEVNIPAVVTAVVVAVLAYLKQSPVEKKASPPMNDLLIFPAQVKE